MKFVLLLGLVLLTSTLQACFPIIAAGVGTGVLMTQDRRSNKAYVEDQQIEVSVTDRIDKEVKGTVHVNITSFNHRVLISGEVFDEAAKAAIGKIASTIDNVSVVNNELVVSDTSSLASRSNDSLITSAIKLQFIDSSSFSADHIKVVTENGTVFLLGIVNHAEADAASEIASTTNGVLRVIRLFEYLN